MNQLLLNFKEVFSNKKYIIFSFVTFIVVLGLFELFTNHILIKGNFGEVYYYSLLFFQYLISILFSIFLSVSVYKYVKFSSFELKENTSSFFGTFIGVLVAGCPACSVTVASYLGLAGLISFFPWHGLELKIIGTILLIYANYIILKDLNLCNISYK